MVAKAVVIIFPCHLPLRVKRKKKVEENKETELDAIVVFQTSSGLSSLLAKSLSQEHWDMTCMWEEDR